MHGVVCMDQVVPLIRHPIAQSKGGQANQPPPLPALLLSFPGPIPTTTPTPPTSPATPAMTSDPHNLQITITTAAASSSSTLSHNHHHPSSSSIGGGPNQACAACKYQRRKCNPDCPLARYFPADQQPRFLKAHKLFGVGNIQRTLRDTPPDLRNDAMRALIYQSEARAFDPVGGCAHLVFKCAREVDRLEAELKAVERHLAACRNHQADDADALDDDGSRMMMLVGAGTSAYGVPVDALYAAGGQEVDYGQPSADHYLLSAAADQVAQPHQQYDYFYYDGPAGDETSSHAWSYADNNVQQHYGNGYVVKAESPVASLGDDDQIETQFIHAFDVKPEIAVANAVVMDHDAGSDDSFDHQLEGKVFATVVKKEHLGHQAAAQMAVESSTAVSRCQLELGFSSF